MGQDTSAVRQSIATLNATIGEQVRKMNEMVRAGQMGTKEFTQLNAAIRKNEGALRTLNRQLGDTGKKFGGLDMGQIGGALTGGIIGGGQVGHGPAVLAGGTGWCTRSCSESATREAIRPGA